VVIIKLLFTGYIGLIDNRWSVTRLRWKSWTTLWWNKESGYLYPKVW